MSTQYTATGTVSSVDEIQKFDKFSKRSFALDIEDGQYPQTVAFELQKELDRVTPLDIGRQVEVSFNLRGRRSKKDGRVWNTLAVWKLKWLTGAPEAEPEMSREEPPPRPDRNPAPPAQPTVPGFSSPADDGSDIPF